MTTDLSELHERIQYNKDEIIHFSKELNSFLKSSLIRRIENMGSGQNLFVTPTRAVPIGIRSKAGCIINDLRTILDSLACVLARRNKATNVKKVYFPIAQTEALFESDAREKMKKLSANDQKTITDLKPWAEGFPSLYLLHSADISRKHYSLTAATIDGPEITLNGINMGAGVSIHQSYFDGTYFDAFLMGDESFPQIGQEYSVYINAPKDLSKQVRFGICFKNLEFGDGENVMKSLDEFVVTVKSIVNKFN